MDSKNFPFQENIFQKISKKWGLDFFSQKILANYLNKFSRNVGILTPKTLATSMSLTNLV